MTDPEIVHVIQFYQPPTNTLECAVEDDIEYDDENEWITGTPLDPEDDEDHEQFKVNKSWVVSVNSMTEETYRETRESEEDEEGTGVSTGVM